MRQSLFSSFNHTRFRFRGKELQRIEALSDAVFAFSVSLLVASLEVPQTFGELKRIARGVIPFFATVALLFVFWYRQYLFFRMYGLNDFRIIVLNLFYLAVILFYVYPLKFLFSLLISNWTGINLFEKATVQGLTILATHDFPQLIILFSVGYLLIWLLLYLMHRHVLHMENQFDFTRYELLFTQKETRGAFWNALIGAAGIVLALLHLEWLAGTCYLLIPVVLLLNEYLFRSEVKNNVHKKRNKAVKEVHARLKKQ